MMRTISTALLLALTAQLPLAAPAADAAVPTCRGLTATHVGTPGEELRTTPGRDVVVTNGATKVTTLNGDDVICATRSRFVFIVPGGGDDVVDAREFAGDNLETSLGNPGVEGGSGTDVYEGGDQVDQVSVSSGRRADVKYINLRAGADMLRVARTYPGEVSVEMGVGNDTYWADHSVRGDAIDGDVGRDELITECPGCDAFEMHMRTGDIAIDDQKAGQAVKFEDVTVLNFGAPLLPRAQVWATRKANDITLTACTTDVRGRGGDDTMTVVGDDCAEPSSTMQGGDGDDVMVGSDGADTLLGGDGHDEAHGRAGEDRCEAEVTAECEL